MPPPATDGDSPGAVVIKRELEEHDDQPLEPSSKLQGNKPILWTSNYSSDVQNVFAIHQILGCPNVGVKVQQDRTKAFRLATSNIWILKRRFGCPQMFWTSKKFWMSKTFWMPQ